MESNQIHNELMRAIGRIEGKIDGFLNDIKKIEDKLESIESIIGVHQTFIDTWKGKLGVVAAIVSAVIAIIVAVVSNYLSK